MKRIFASLFLVLIVASQTALAQEDKIIREEDKVVYKKETELDFSDVNVNGELIKPNAAYVKNRRKTRFPALIELRANFRPELAQTIGFL